MRRKPLIVALLALAAWLDGSAYAGFGVGGVGGSAINAAAEFYQRNGLDFAREQLIIAGEGGDGSCGAGESIDGELVRRDPDGYFTSVEIGSGFLPPQLEPACGDAQRGIVCTAIPAAVLQMPVYNADGKKCEFLPSHFYERCRSSVGLRCEEWVPNSAASPYHPGCVIVKLISTVCDACGEQEDFFVAGNQVADVAITAAEVEADIKTMRDLISLGWRQEGLTLGQVLIDRVAHKHGFSRSPIPVKILIGPRVSLDGNTVATIDKKEDTIYIGMKAFESEGVLASTIGHEMRHIVYRHFTPKWLYNDKESVAWDEYLAYEWEIVNQSKTGLRWFDLDRYNKIKWRDHYFNTWWEIRKSRSTNGRVTTPWKPWLPYLWWDDSTLADPTRVFEPNQQPADINEPWMGRPPEPTKAKLSDGPIMKRPAKKN